MDIATLLGLFVGMALVLGSIMIGSSLAVFCHIPSLMITVGGTLASTLINFSLAQVIGVFAVVKKTVIFSLPKLEEQINVIIEYNRIARRDGVNALEDQMPNMYPLLRSGLQLMMDNVPPESVREILEKEMENSQARHMMGKKILQSMGAAAPAFGMIGTLIGLVQMLQNLEDPSMIGQGMATALLTTFYGAMMANLIFLPLAGKLETRDYEEQVLHELLLEGVMSIQSGEHPFIMQERLKVFIAGKKREKIKINS